MTKLPDSAFPNLVILSAWRFNLFMALCFVGIWILFILRVSLGSPLEWSSGLVVVLTAIALPGIYFCWRGFFPQTVLRISSKGIWTARAGLQPWFQVDELLVEKRKGFRNATEYWLVLHWNEEVDLPAEKLLQEFRFDSLSISRKRFERQMRLILEIFQDQ